MTKRLAQNLTTFALQQNILAEKDAEIYKYSYQIFIESVFILVSIFAIGISIDCVFPTILYLAFFIPLRIFSGGWHARQFSACYVLTIALYLASLVISVYFSQQISVLILLLVVAISSLVVYRLSPLADQNKPESPEDLHKYKRYTNIILGTEGIVLLMMAALEINMVYVCFGVCGIVQQSILLLLGYRENCASE